MDGLIDKCIFPGAYFLATCGVINDGAESIHIRKDCMLEISTYCPGCMSLKAGKIGQSNVL